jgi:hypothetical protein
MLFKTSYFLKYRYVYIICGCGRTIKNKLQRSLDEEIKGDLSDVPDGLIMYQLIKAIKIIEVMWSVERKT